MTTPLTRLGPLSLEEFFTDYWQQQAVVLPAALADFRSPLTPQELAGLALEEDVESRLITHTTDTPWQLRHGPFSESDFTTLKHSNWTLLVQAVDLWVPAVAELLEHFRFIPHWRLDDIMVSYAPTGGSVGPHFDYYDVFLLQGAGRRRWQLGGLCDSQTPRLEHTPLHILRDFSPQTSVDLEPGDLLYIPPGIAHWGTSLNDDCMTYSIGFRAPSHAHMLSGVANDIAASLADDQRLRDRLRGPSHQPGQIDGQTLKDIQQLLHSYITTDRIGQWLGCHATEAKYPDLLEPNPVDLHTLNLWHQQHIQLAPVPGVRLSYTAQSDTHEQVHLFAAGKAYGSSADTARLLCETPHYTLSELYATGDKDQVQSLICQLCGDGVLDKLLW